MENMKLDKEIWFVQTDDNKKWWQFWKKPSKPSHLLDGASLSDISDTSSFNILADNRNMAFKIPVGEISSSEAQEDIAKIIAHYSEPISFDDESGEIIFNDGYKPSLNKEMWFTSPVGDNINIKDVESNELIRDFKEGLEIESKIPLDRFDSPNFGISDIIKNEMVKSSMNAIAAVLNKTLIEDLSTMKEINVSNIIGIFAINDYYNSEITETLLHELIDEKNISEYVYHTIYVDSENECKWHIFHNEKLNYESSIIVDYIINNEPTKFWQ